MRFPPLRPRPAAPRSRRGVALIIVLAFVVLLTGLIIAFFSRSISERQISNSSAGQVKIDLFTQGAIATITDDLKQEIAAGSNATYITDASGKTLASVYVPFNNVGGAPALALKGQQSAVTTFAPNLVKRSAYGQNFFPAGSDTNAGYYNTNNAVTVLPDPPVGTATPAPSAAPTRPPSNRATNLSTTTASQNGRSITATRWNKPLLLPRNTASLSDPAKTDPLSTAFVAPDWVLSARDGSNPGSIAATALTFGPGQTSSVNDPSPANPGFVTGRYAYTIYDEGGLLDANVAGYPTDAAKYPSGGAASLPLLPTAKTALAYADLTVPITLPDGTAQTNLLTPAQVNTLVGWRNYASSQPTGTFPSFTPSATVSPTPYPSPYASPTYSLFDQAILADTSGFMGVNRYNVLSQNGQSDRMFGSRQQLISFFTQALPTSATDKVSLSNLENSLQYFSTFSRSLNQPSYAPVSRVSIPSNPYPRPLIQPAKNPGGGNNVGDNYTMPAQQDIFSPSLLSVRVEPTAGTGGPQWLRNDGKTASVLGEPLLKSRFALQRLSWITYKGPSFINQTDPNVQALSINYGILPAYVQKGTGAVNGIPGNIEKYFGLTWDATNHVWRYSVHNGGAVNTLTATGSIMKLREIADQGLREPDFFEILKATVDVSALGKASTNAPQAQGGEPNGNSHVEPLNFQYYRDVNVDAAIIQLGANIIDQFDLDGYPTRIVFNDGNGDREFRGVENLPYIYRIRLGGLKVREANPPSERPAGGANTYIAPMLHSGTMAGYTAKPLRDTGAGVVMAVPDIWNPHDQNSSLGSPRPGSPSSSSPTIRLVANSAMPETVYTAPDPPPAATATPPSGYGTLTTGTTIGTDNAHGNMSPSKPPQFSANGTPGAYANPSASPEPIPNFTRVTNLDGRVSGAALVMSGTNGGFINPHPIDTATASYLTFKVPDEKVYREPTMLGIADPSGPTGLTMVVDANNLDIRNVTNTGGARAYVDQLGLKSQNPLNGLTPNPLNFPPDKVPNPLTQAYCGITLGTFPLRWVGPKWSGSDPNTVWHYSAWSLADAASPTTAAITYSLQYLDPQPPSKWVTYDEKYVDSDLTFVSPYDGALVQPKGGAYAFMDPRTARFGAASENNIADAAHYRAPTTPVNWLDNTITAGKVSVVAVTERPDETSGFGSNFRGTNGEWGSYPAPGLHSQLLPPGAQSGVNAIFFQTGLFAQNDPNFPSDGKRFLSDGGLGTRDANFTSDADGVVRRAMGAFVDPTTGTSTVRAAGQPLATSTTYQGTITPTAYSQNRPIILNRPFRTVGELGYVFSGMPWKNIDFSTPESAYSELLDVFCVNDNAPADGLVAGTVDLNTRNAMVIKSVLTGSSMDEENTFIQVPAKGVTTIKPLLAQDAEAIATALTDRTSRFIPPKRGATATGPAQPLQNVGDLVGRWNSNQSITASVNPMLGVHNVDGARSYEGLGDDISIISKNQKWSSTGMADTIKITRMRESAVRALSNVGNVRVWNLMIDVIAQSGRYPTGVTALKSGSGADNFIVDGEQRYWVHLAIDRYTGKVLDTKLELVKE